MRWKYLIPRLALVTLGWALLTFALDPALRWSLESGGRNLAGAVVNVGAVETDWNSLRINASGVAVANRWRPGTNLVEFQQASLDLDGAALLHKSFVVTDGRIDGVRWGSPRADSGRLPEAPSGEAFEFAWPDFGLDLPNDTGAWLEKLASIAAGQLSLDGLESVRLAERLDGEWRRELDSLDDEIERLRRELASLNQAIAQADGNTFEKLKTYRESAERSQRLLSDAEALRKRLTEAIAKAEQDMGDIESAWMVDRDRLKDGIQSFTLDPGEIGESLVGSEVIEGVEVWGSRLATLQELITRLTDHPEPVRWRGVDVPFAVDDSRPAVLFRHLLLDGSVDVAGQTRPMRMQVRNLTSHPSRHGKPLEFEVELDGSQHVRIAGSSDLTASPPVHRFAIHHAVDDAWSWRREDKLASITATLPRPAWHGEFTLVGRELHGRMQLDESPVQFDLALNTSDKRLPDSLAEIVRSSFAGIDRLEMAVDVSGTLPKPAFQLQTDLGRRVKENLELGTRSWLAERKDELLAEASSLASQRTNGLHAMLNERLSLASRRLVANEQTAGSLLNRIATDKLDVRALLRR